MVVWELLAICIFVLFAGFYAGSETGAERAAILYSLVASCKLNNLDPFAYFRDVLTKVSTHPANKIDELLPAHWKTMENATDKAVA